MPADLISRRDFQVISVIGVVHLLSHAYQFTLAPLFPVMALEPNMGGLGVSYSELGLLASLFFASSGLCQTPAGFVVDKIGPRPVLIAGLGLLSAAVFLYSVVPSYGSLIVLSILAGIGNSVFHPADYSLINGAVSENRLGSAYGFHSIGGYIGFALAPAMLPLTENLIGWRGAVAGAGLIGIIVTIFLFFWKPDLRLGETSASTFKKEDDQSIRSGIAVLLQPTILLGFLFFFILAMGLIGFKTMGPTALHEGWQLSIAFSGNAIASFSVAAVIGIAIGGVWADNSDNHHRNATWTFVISGSLIVMIPWVPANPTMLIGILIVSGCSFGIALPNRDLFIKSLTPKGASGRVFGFVYCGLDVGASLTPFFFGILMDLGKPELVIIVAGCLMFLAAGIIFLTEPIARRVLGKS